MELSKLYRYTPPLSEIVVPKYDWSEWTVMMISLFGTDCPNNVIVSPRRTSDLSAKMVGAIKMPVTFVIAPCVRLNGNETREDRLPLLSSLYSEKMKFPAARLLSVI